MPKFYLPPIYKTMEQTWFSYFNQRLNEINTHISELEEEKKALEWAKEKLCGRLCIQCKGEGKYKYLISPDEYSDFVKCQVCGGTGRRND